MAWEEGLDNKAWTAEIKGCLAMVGNRLGFKICGSNVDVPVDRDERLFDQTWFKRREGAKWSDGLALAAEIEWGPGVDWV